MRRLFSLILLSFIALLACNTVWSADVEVEVEPIEFQPFDAEQVKLGDWYRIGPFRDQGPLTNWMDNVASSFAFEFDVEKDALAKGGEANLKKKYPAPNFPPTPKAVREWVCEPNWIDGYYQQLPRAFAPATGETQYVYRTITVPEATQMPLHFLLRAPEADRRSGGRGMEEWRRTGRFCTWVNGELSVQWEGKGDMPKQVTVPLKAGVNHFLAKVTNNRHYYGFAFSIEGLHPQLRHERGFERMWREHILDLPSEHPYFVENNRRPPKLPAKQLYDEGLQRLRALRFWPKPMPGVEAAEKDSQGRVVPAMEKYLEKYPTSPAGDKHTARLEQLRKIVKPLLAKVDAAIADPTKDDFKLYQREVSSAVERLEKMWEQTIRELPLLVYLERPSYSYDSMMYENAGSKDAVLKSFDPARRQIKTIFDFSKSPEATGANEFNLSWDGKTFYIGGMKTVAALDRDGKNYRKITTGQSPCEMPDGRLVFFDNDTGQSPCKGGGSRRPLFICDPDGENRKVVSANTCIDTAPTVMDDGRIIFTRWDYGVNKNVFNRHALWTQNPDGTGMDLFFGNTVIDPRSLCRARQVPGRPEVLTIFGPHHSKLAGLMGLVWNGEGKEAKDGLGFRRITHDTASVGDIPQVWSYQDPFPLNEQLFLVSFGGREKNKVALYLYDRSGNRKCLLEAASPRGIHSAQPFIAKKRPRVVPDRCETVNWEPNVDLHKRLLTDPNWGEKGTLMLQDVYLGIEPEVKRGQAKYLAVMEQPLQSHGRGGAIGVGTIWFVNRCIGLVPIEKDGSAHFEVPALRSLYFHVLDKDGRMLMTQGSDFHMMPGEVRSCVGCHEQRKGIDSPPGRSQTPLAMKKPPVRPKMPDWGTNGIIEYETVVQPVLDKYCVRCHSGEKPKGNVNLTGDKTTAYNMSYMQLTDGGFVHFTPGTGHTHSQPTNDSDEHAPLSRGTLLSKVTKHIQDPKHCEKKIPFDEQLRVFLWIDSNVPFFSHYTQVPPMQLKDDAIKELKAVHARRCASCHDPKQFMPDEKSGLNASHIGRHVGGLAGQWGIAPSGMRVRHLNLTNPTHSAAVLAPLAKKAGGWGLCQKEDETPVFKDKNDADYKRIVQAIQKSEKSREGLLVTGAKELIEALREEEAQEKLEAQRRLEELKKQEELQKQKELEKLKELEKKKAQAKAAKP